MTTAIQTSDSLNLDQLSLVLRCSDTGLANEENKTLVLYESSMVTMQQQIMSLADKNRDLSTALITVESQHREIETLHIAEISALQEEVQFSKAAEESMRKEMLETMQKAHEMGGAALAEKEVAVKAATELADARVSAARLEFEAELQKRKKEQHEGLVSHVDFLGVQISYYLDQVVAFYAQRGITTLNPWIGHTRDITKHDLDRLKGNG